MAMAARWCSGTSNVANGKVTGDGAATNMLPTHTNLSFDWIMAQTMRNHDYGGSAMHCMVVRQWAGHFGAWLTELGTAIDSRGSP